MLNFVYQNIKSLIRRFKAPFLINLIGMTAALTVAIILLIQSYYDFTHNRGFDKSKDLFYYHIYDSAFGEETDWMSAPLFHSFLDRVPEVKNGVAVWSDKRIKRYNIQRENVESLTEVEILMLESSPGFLEIFTPEILYGDPRGVFEAFANHQMMISDKAAKRIFGRENVVGTQLISQDDVMYTIAAVYKEFPKNTSVYSEAVIYSAQYEKNDDSNWSFLCYYEIDHNVIKAVEEKINQDILYTAEELEYIRENPEYRDIHYLTPFVDIHLHHYAGAGNFYLSIGMVTMGVLLVVVALINLLNISYAMVPSRVKAINVHKILGLKSGILRRVISLEGVIVAIISFILALIAVYYFGNSSLVEFFTASMSLSDNWRLIALFGAIFILLTLLVGVVPARRLADFDVSITLKGKFAISRSASTLRNILITAQFLIAITLTVVTLYIYLQINYVRNYDLGLNKENVIVLPIKDLDQDYKLFGEELKKNSNIIDYTTAFDVPGKIIMTWGRYYQDKFVQFTSWIVQSNFLDFFGINLLAGDDFSLESQEDLRMEILLNDKFIEKYEFKYSDVLGSGLNGGKVIGIVEDINFASLHSAIGPMALISNSNHQMQHIFIKLGAGKVKEGIESIQNTWKNFSHRDCNIQFLDDELDELYNQEELVGKLILSASIITIMIAMIGVYGLIRFNVRYREREIAIRKINGSSVSQILQLFSRKVVVQIAIAYIIALPFSVYLIKLWSEQFAFRLSPPIWIFAAALLLMFVLAMVTILILTYKAATANPIDKIKVE